MVRPGSSFDDDPDDDLGPPPPSALWGDVPPASVPGIAAEPRRRRRGRRAFVLGGIAAVALGAGAWAFAFRAAPDVEAGDLPATAGAPQASAVQPSASPQQPATATPDPPTTAPPPPASPPAGDAATLLAALEVKGRAQHGDYDRDLFGQAWLDVDRNGCDTRNDVLRRDLLDIRLKPDTNGCAVLTGTLIDPYTGTTIEFERGPRSSEVQIDHVVALGDAWQKGARDWTDEQRATFANDPLNLLAVDGEANQQKQASDAATWLPPNRAYWCDYAARIVAVKAEYGLWVTPAEADALERVLTPCPDQRVPEGGA